MTPRRAFFSAFVLLATAVCSELPEEPQVLSIKPGPEARELRVGTEQQLVAQLGGRAVPAEWTTSDTSIARIDATGVLRIAPSYSACDWIEPGECAVDVVARAEGITSSQRITVVPVVELIAPGIYLEMGDSSRLLPRFAAEGREVFWCTVGDGWSWDTRIAQLRDNGYVVAGDAGATRVDMSITGRACPAVSVSVAVYEPLHTLTILPVDDIHTLLAGQSAQLTAHVTNWKGIEYSALAPQWSSSDATILSVDEGRIVAVGCKTAAPCRATITVRSGRLTAARTITVMPAE
jgi:hypothetical protein